MAAKKAAKTPVKKTKATAGAKKVPAKKTEEFPFAPMMDLRKRMDQLFDEYMHGWPRFPSLARDLWDTSLLGEPFARLRGEMVDVRFDVSESDQALEITAELPGMDEKDVEVTLSDGLLSIKGEKKSETEEKKKDFHVSERRYGSFTRSLRVPDSVDQDKISAAFDKGVLHLTMPKRAEAKARKKKIAVTKK